MPVLIDQQPMPAPPPEPRRKRWTRSEFEFLETTALFAGTRYELIDGELIDKMSMNERPAVALTLLAAWLFRVFGKRVRLQVPMDVRPEDNPTNEPQPDAAVLHLPIGELKGRRPSGADVALAVEAADSSLELDTSAKARLYARGGIADYWVLDLRGRRLIVHRDPDPAEGRYRSIAAYAEGETLSPLAAPDAAVWVRELLPEDEA
jgi:Uma2 family endonuclease